jgi:NAD(P)H-flavin reductase
MQANKIDNGDSLPVSLFRAGLESVARNEDAVSVAGPLPEQWTLGTELFLRGPLGRGFSLPPRLRHLALVAFGSPARLLPLIPMALEQEAEVVLICDVEVKDLPLAVETQSLDALPNALAWADFVAVDMELADLEELPNRIGASEGLRRSLRGQALVHSAMPCGGLARCGVCSLVSKKGQRFACEDGPVFDLHELI